MTDPRTTFVAYVDEASAAVGLSIDAGERAEVTANLKVLVDYARLVMDFPLPETDEPAPRFTP